jgi:hypothetical protein
MGKRQNKKGLNGGKEEREPSNFAYQLLAISKLRKN